MTHEHVVGIVACYYELTTVICAIMHARQGTQRTWHLVGHVPIH